MSCPSSSCALTVTSWVHDAQLGTIVEARCSVHDRVLYGTHVPPPPPVRLL